MSTSLLQPMMFNLLLFLTPGAIQTDFVLRTSKQLQQATDHGWKNKTHWGMFACGVLPILKPVYFPEMCDTHLSPPSPLCVVTDLSICHKFQASISLPALFLHLNLGLPLGCFPSIFISATALPLMFSVSSLIFTCPNHLWYWNPCRHFSTIPVKFH